MDESFKNKDINQVPLSTLETWSGYWRALSDRKKHLHDVSVRQIMLGQVFTIVVTMAAGFFISENTEALLLIGTALLLYPVLAESLSSNSSVLVSSLHHEIDSVDTSKAWFVTKALLNSLLVAVIACVFLGVASGVIGVVAFDASFVKSLTLAVYAGGLTGLIGFPIMIAVLFIARRMQVNPDDVAAPIETTVFNTVALVSIVIVSRVIL